MIGYLKQKAVKRIFSLPAALSGLFLLPFGYAGEPPKAKQTKARAGIGFMIAGESAAKT
ncbi:MAG: hypothetical protein LLG09_04050 [Negativicutes bacterium]|nr:hypothetical protein [Negativicutes bacterium]